MTAGTTRGVFANTLITIGITAIVTVIGAAGANAMQLPAASARPAVTSASCLPGEADSFDASFSVFGEAADDAMNATPISIAQPPLDHVQAVAAEVFRLDPNEADSYDAVVPAETGSVYGNEQLSV
jgi:hypothetical protein